MKIVGHRLRSLRENLHISQKKLAEIAGTTQSAINRYENALSAPPLKTLLWYADYFDISMDYIFGRTDQPQGKLYDYEPQAVREKTEQSEQLRQFVDMCFDPNSPMHDKLKATLVKMLEEGNK